MYREYTKESVARCRARKNGSIVASAKNETSPVDDLFTKPTEQKMPEQNVQNPPFSDPFPPTSRTYEDPGLKNLVKTMGDRIRKLEGAVADANMELVDKDTVIEYLQSLVYSLKTQLDDSTKKAEELESELRELIEATNKNTDPFSQM